MSAARALCTLRRVGGERLRAGALPGRRAWSAQASPPLTAPAWFPLALGVAGLGAGVGTYVWVSAPIPKAPPAKVEDNGAAAERAARRAEAEAALAASFMYDREVRGAVPRRFKMEVELRRYMNSKHAEVMALQRSLQSVHPSSAQARIQRQEYDRGMQALQEEISHRTQAILYGVREEGARDRYLEEYGCARWTEAALDVVKSHGKIVEIGAGSGHWQRALAARGADVVAYDNFSAIPQPDKPVVGKVGKGDERMIRKHRDRALLIVYPDNDDMARKCLDHYQGARLLYAGEGPGGVNASPAFFEELERGWEVEHVEPLDPFPECFEKLWVLRRKEGVPPPGGGAGGWRGWLTPWRR